MKVSHILALIILLAPIFIGCVGNNSKKKIVADNEIIEPDTSKQPLSHYFYSGELFIDDESAIFKDCITNNEVEVLKTGDLKKVIKEYAKKEGGADEGKERSFLGYLTPLNIDDENEEYGIVITNLIKFDDSNECNTANSLTTSNYTRYSPNDKAPIKQTIISLGKDYTFECVTYQLKPMQLVNSFKGKWHRTDTENIVLLVDGAVLYEGVIDFSNMSLILQNDNEKQVIFVKE